MESTRIAIATADGATVCDHLARASAFVVVEVDSGVPGARIDDALQAWVEGRLATSDERTCLCTPA